MSLIICFFKECADSYFALHLLLFILTYQLTTFYGKMLGLEKALTSADLETINKTIIVTEEKANRMYRHEQTCTSLSEKEIFSKFKEAFKVYTKRSMDTPRYAYVSCERLCYKKKYISI